MYDIVIRYEDGRRDVVASKVGDLGDACAYVLKLADDLGSAMGDDDVPPKWVEIFRDDHLEISISVVRGGMVRRTEV